MWVTRICSTFRWFDVYNHLTLVFHNEITTRIDDYCMIIIIHHIAISLHWVKAKFVNVYHYITYLSLYLKQTITQTR